MHYLNGQKLLFKEMVEFIIGILTVLVAYFLGIFLAVLYEISKSLTVCCLFHGTANVTAVVMTRLLVNGQSAQTAGQAGAMMAAGGFMLVALFMVLCMKIRREGIRK